MPVIKIVIVISSIFIFASCGGGTPPVEQEPMKKLFLIDSPINGVDYECGVRKDKSKSQIVDGIERDGVVNCRKGAVTFRIGNLIIGKLEKYKDAQEVYLQDLIKISQDTFDNTELLKLGMFIQSIDDDGDINQTINITDEIKNKITIESLDNMNISDVQGYITKLGKTPRDISDVKEHIMDYSGIPYIQDLNITISDDSSVGTIIASLDITNSDNLSDIEIIKGDDRDYFYISKVEKTIQLNKEVDYKNKYLYNYQIQATNSKGKSNIAMINIHITTEDIENMQDLNKAGMGDNIIYTKNDSYEITIEAKEGVKVYLDGYDTYQVVDETGKITIKEDILSSNTREEHNIILGYENGTKSEPKLFVIIKDTINPIITTPNDLSVEENVKIVTNIDVEDINKDYGLEYSILGIDSQYFNISQIGEVSFKNRPDYEVPLDENGDNIYEIEVKVSDKSGNQISKVFSITIVDVLDFLPIIYEFVTDISISENVGNTIAQISFTSGSSKVTNITLAGDGADKFTIDNNGALRLLQKIAKPTIFKPTVNVTNEYGTVSKEITLNMVDKDKLAIAQLNGVLSNATVKIIKLNYNTNKEELVYTEQTSNIGTFNTHSKELEHDTFYIFEVTDGIDKISTKKNKGVLRLIAKGEWIQNTNSTIRITTLSEMQYVYIVRYIKHAYSVEYFKNIDYFDNNKIKIDLDEISSILINKDLNGDEIINAKDILIFNPLIHQDSLYKTIRKDDFIQNITDKIMVNDMTYIEDIFFSCVLLSFENIYDLKVNGSFAYIYGDNYFYIYDIVNQKKVSEIHLPKTYDDYSFISSFMYGENIDLMPKIYLDLNNNLVYLSSLDANTIEINVGDITNPKVDNTYTIGAGKYIIKKDKNILFFSKGISIQFSEDLSFTVDTDDGNPGLAYKHGDERPGTKDGKIQYILGDTVALDITDSDNLISYNHIPFFNTIISYQNKLFGYNTFVTFSGYNSSCLLYNEYYIGAYNISDIQKEQNLTSIEYKMLDCATSDYFDTQGYFYKMNYYEHELKIYNFFKNSDTVIGNISFDTEYYLLDIYNHYGENLYLVGLGNGPVGDDDNHLISVNVSEPERPYINNIINIGYLFSYFQVYNDIIVTNSIMDLNSFRYLTQYIPPREDKVNINLDLFKRFED